MIHSFNKFKLFENPNEIFFNGKRYGYTYPEGFEKTSIPFASITGKEYNDDLGERVEVGAWGGKHEDMLNFKYKISNYDGRLWKDIKVISFWDYPEDKEKLKHIIKELERMLGFKIWNNDYKIEVITGDVDSKGNYPTKFIPLEDYKQKLVDPNRILHLMSPEEKSKHMKGWVRSVMKKKKPLKYKYKLYQEIYNFESFKNEYNK